MPTANDKKIAKPLIYCRRSIFAWQQGAKGQARRLVRPQPKGDQKLWQDSEDVWWSYEEYMLGGPRYDAIRQPYAVGDLLWIREGLQRSYHLSDTAIVVYQADWKVAAPDGLVREWDWERYKLPAIFMPRWACRYHARVTSVRPERLQDISVEDCVAEGMPAYTRAKGVLSATPPDHRWWYTEWWDELHKKPGTRWADNPWVWVYGLEAAEAGG